MLELTGLRAAGVCAGGEWDGVGERLFNSLFEANPPTAKEGSGGSRGYSLCQDGSGTHVPPGLVMGACAPQAFPSQLLALPITSVRGWDALCLCLDFRAGGFSGQV